MKGGQSDGAKRNADRGRNPDQRSSSKCDASLVSQASTLGHPQDRTRILGTGLRQIFSQRIPISEV